MMEASDILLGIYFPIIILSAKVVLRIVIDVAAAAAQDKFRLEQHSLALAAGFAIAAHLYENLYFGLARWFGAFDTFNRSILGVGFGKLLILFACICALASVWSWGSVRMRLAVASMLAFSLWGVAAVIAVRVA